jgi:hypothetical protein
MAAKRCTVRITANFEANLDAIERFLTTAGAPAAYDALLDDLTGQVIPALETHPDIGRLFLQRAAHSVEGIQRIKQIASRLGSMVLREYLAGDYIILYGVQEKSVYLLSIKHHRQRSFDLSTRER